MRDLLERKFFPFVIKPGRYCGGEPGQIRKDPAGRISYLHAYPDRYEIGHAYVGLQTLYHVVNADDRFICERVFTVDHDAEAIMSREQIPLFSLESSRPAAQFDAIGFTLVNELVYTNMLAMLDLAGIPLRSSERTEQHPIIMAGGPAAFFPEPIADFVDLFFIGDAEEGLPEILALLHRSTSATRREKLERIAREIQSVYVPAFYDSGHRPIDDGIPARIKARIVETLKPEYYPAQPIVPLVETVHNYLNIEIMRGCPQGCRFCMASAMYKPVRTRSRHEITAQIETQLANTGYSDVSLMSLSTSDYPEIEPLAVALAGKLERGRVGLFLPSLRPGTITAGLLDAVKRVRKGGFTIAPETGTERLRRFIRKNITDDQILDSARLAFEKGWNTIKLYFMIGLPTETDEDLRGIADLCRKIWDLSQQTPGRKTINVTLSPFIPSPHTPFQWDAACTQEELAHRVTIIRQQTRNNNIHYRYSESLQHDIACAFQRGGRELCAVIETAYRLGCRFDGWDEERKPELWKQAFADHQIERTLYLKAIPFDAVLPWGFIDKGPSAEHLMSDRKKLSVETFAEPEPSTIRAVAADVGTVPVDTNQYGRAKKKVLVKSTSAPTKNRLRLRWGKSDRYRYMSHLDNLRLFERILRRAGTPVQYSQGFNPTMKLSYSPPLPLGFTSEAEYLDIVLDANLLPYMVDDIRRTLPEGLVIHDARVVLGQGGSLSALINRVEYTVPVSYWENPDTLKSQVDDLMRQPTLTFSRETKDGQKQIDLKPAVFDLRVEFESLVLTVAVGEGGYARPNEVATFLKGGMACDVIALPFHRRAMFREADNGRRINPMEL
jgi:radical SAM family uncharacterized protein/radical SAM-linked protein